MATNTDEGGENQVIMPRSAQANAFFRFSFACFIVLCGMLVISNACDRYFSLYLTMASRICIVVVAAAVLAGKSISMLNICSKCVHWVVRRLRVPTPESNCVTIAFFIQNICDVTCLDDRMDDTFSLVVMSALSLFLIFTVAISFRSDRSGMTGGLLIQFGKMLILYMKAGKLWQPIICALVVIFAIISMLTELADVGSDNSTALQQKKDYEGQNEAFMRRSALAITLFRLSSLFIRGFGFIVTIKFGYDRISSEYMTIPVRMCIIFVTAGIFTGGYSLYVKLLQWLSHRLHGRKDKRWFVIFVILAICDTFLDKHKMLPLALLSALSVITLCILNTGWGITGITDGILVGFSKWLLRYMLLSELPYSVVICGLVLLFVVVSKSYEAKVENSLRVGPDASTCSTKKD